VGGSIPKIEEFDDIRVKAILNEIDGRITPGPKTAPVPAIFGLTFQAVTQAQKSKAGYGYVDASGTPSEALLDALNHTDQSIGKILDELKARSLSSSTAVIITAKHGQSPMDIEKSRLWIRKQSRILSRAFSLVAGRRHRRHHLHDLAKGPKQDGRRCCALTANQASAHIQRILSGEGVKLMFRDPLNDSRTPDIIVEPDSGLSIANPKTVGIAEHGGLATKIRMCRFSLRTRHSPVGRSRPLCRLRRSHLQFSELGLDPQKLEAVKIEKTQVLPGLF